MEKLLDLKVPKEIDLSVITLDSDCCLFEMANQSVKQICFQLGVDRNNMIFWFPTSGSVKLTCSIDDSWAKIQSEKYFLSSFPRADWLLDIDISGKSSIRGLFISLSKLHKLLDLEINDDSMASGFTVRKIFIEKDFHVKIKIAVDNLFIKRDKALPDIILQKGIILEILSYFMDYPRSRNEKDESSGCPYIRDNTDLEKIKKAEKILIDSILEPPTIRSLARQVGTNELKLKEGFKHVYGNTIFGYLLDYKMNLAKQLLDQNSLQVKDVSEQVGYSNPSHFITAFKSRFGLTPKKYLMSLTSD